MGLRGPGAKPVEMRVLEGTADSVIAFPTTTEAATQPAGMDEAERAVWNDVVTSFPLGMFKAADRHHLAAYCSAVVLWSKAKSEVHASPMQDGKPNAWLKVMKQQHSQMVQLGDRLGIGPSRRTLSVEKSATAKRKASLLYRPGQNK